MVRDKESGCLFIRESIRRASTSFLAIPTGIIAGLVLLAIGAYGLEQADPDWLRPFPSFMQDHFAATQKRTAPCWEPWRPA